MYQSMHCNQCGYDMTGPELIAHMTDPSSEYAYSHHSPTALLNVCTRSASSVACPFCHTVGNWMN
ncbi:MAG: hypothetical protein ACRCTE_08790 [Cellulosilyticaceae bacterium]